MAKTKIVFQVFKMCNVLVKVSIGYEITKFNFPSGRGRFRSRSPYVHMPEFYDFALAALVKLLSSQNTILTSK